MPPVRLTVADMQSILTRWRDDVRQARHSFPALRRFVCRRQAADVAGATDEKRMADEFLAILAEVPPETAERLRLLDDFASVLHEAGMMMQDWNHTLNEAEAGGGAFLAYVEGKKFASLAQIDDQ